MSKVRNLIDVAISTSVDDDVDATNSFSMLIPFEYEGETCDSSLAVGVNSDLRKSVYLAVKQAVDEYMANKPSYC